MSLFGLAASRRTVILVLAAVLSALAVSSSRAACPAGQSNPITSGDGKGHPAIVFTNLGGAPTGSFFVLGAAGVNSGGLSPIDWLVNLGDTNGDGLPEYAVRAPGEGAGGWRDPRTVGCPSLLTPPRPPIVISLHQDHEDLDGDGAFDVFEDLNHNGVLDPGEDRDGDGRLTPPGGCEGAGREDVDCDGHLDFFYEDRNHNGILDPGEDIDGDRRLDLISEDANFNGVLDPGEDLNQNGVLDIGPYIEDRNHNQTLDDRPFVRPTDVMTAFLPDGTEVPIASWYPYGSFRPAPGGMVTALVTWNGSAYDLSVMSSGTRLVASPDDFAKGSGR